MTATVYRRLMRPALFHLPPEGAHSTAVCALRIASATPVGLATLRASFGARVPPRAAVRALGLQFPSPVLLAAGFDKHATAYPALCALGFGGVEVGTITGEGQPGNPKPRMFRLPADQALLNRMGFNNDGAERTAERLRRRRSAPIGVNIGKTKATPAADAAADYAKGARLLGPLADYLVVNVSSPNTPGLRDLQATAQLRPLLEAVLRALATVGSSPPVLVKIAPDLADEDVLAIADLALELGLSGIVATNTTLSREGLRTPPAQVAAMGAGGISGPVLRSRALQVLKLLRQRTGGRLTLVAAGGITSAEAAWERIVAGAALVQIYTGFIYGGPALPAQLAGELVELARHHGFADLHAAIQHHTRRVDAPPATAPPAAAP